MPWKRSARSLDERKRWRLVAVTAGLALLLPSVLIAQRWGAFQDDGCTAPGIRKFSSRLWDIPAGRSWESACASTAATISGQSFAHPARCNNKGAFGMWGEWDVTDGSCAAHWGAFQDDGCTAVGVRKFASRLWDVPPGQTWEAACAAAPATVAGQAFASPARCNNKGVFGMWGEWDVADASCRAHWGGFQNDGCSAPGIRKFSSRLWDVPPGQTWEAACASAPATVSGQTFAAPARCNNKGLFGMWGEWDLADESCRARWGAFKDEGCPRVGIHKFSSRLSDIPPGQTWKAACETTAATVGGQTFAAPARCNDKGVFGMWGEWDVSDNTCQPKTRLDYTRACEAEMGRVPAFNCMEGEELPITKAGVQLTEPGPECDLPIGLILHNENNYQCVPYARLLRLSTGNPDVETVAICRKYKNYTATSPTNTKFHDIAMIQHNKATGNTCFHQSPVNEEREGTTVPSPMDDSAAADSYWLDPAGVRSNACTSCHDADPFIRSPYIAQKADVARWNPLGEYHPNFLGTFDASGADPRRIHPEAVMGDPPQANACSACHRIGVGSWNGIMNRPGIKESMPPPGGLATDVWRTQYKDALAKIEKCVSTPAATGCGSN